MACVGSNYTPDALVEAFHQIPHVDINLNASTDAFSTSLTYFQAVIIWACLPILVCFCLFILMSVYFILICCCCCCGVEWEKSNTSRWVCAALQVVLLLLCLGLVGASLWAEVALDRDVGAVISSANSISNIVNNASLQTSRFNNSVTQAALTVIRSSATGNANVTAAVTTLMSEANTLQAKLADVAVSLSSLWNAGFGSSVGLLETARHWAVIAYFILVGLVLIIILLAALLRKLPFIVVMVVILFFVTLITWIAVGGSLATLMVTSDICNDPNTVVLNIASTASSGYASYYLTCGSTCPSPTNPFAANINSTAAAYSNSEMQLNIIQSNVTLANMVNASLNTVAQQLMMAQGATLSLEALTGCTPINQNYVNVRQSLCSDAILHAVVQFGLVAALAVCLIIQLLCSGFHAGLVSGPSNKDDDFTLDPFGDLAGGGVSSTNAWNYRGSTSRSNHENIPLTPSEQPPKYSDLTNNRNSGEYNHFSS